MRTQSDAASPQQPFDLSHVPVAERPALAAQDYHDTEEHTVWYNPFDYDVAVQIHVGSTPMDGAWDDPGRLARWRALSPQKRREMQTGIRVFVIPAKTERSIPSDFDAGIQTYQCQEAECAQRPLFCKNRDHRKLIVGGGYPRLINRGTKTHRIVLAPALHYALDDERARAKEALERSKQLLAESVERQGLALVAAADFEKAKHDVAAAEARLAAQSATTESEAHKQVIETAAAGGKPKK